MTPEKIRVKNPQTNNLIEGNIELWIKIKCKLLEDGPKYHSMSNFQTLPILIWIKCSENEKRICYSKSNQ
jgi:hypothetical protein